MLSSPCYLLKKLPALAVVGVVLISIGASIPVQPPRLTAISASPLSAHVFSSVAPSAPASRIGLLVDTYPLSSSERQLAAYITLLHLQTQGEWSEGKLQSGQWTVSRARDALRVLDTVIYVLPDSDYPFFLAAEVWSGWGDNAAQREVMEWVVNHARANPVKRWRWVVQAVWVARYQWRDLPAAVRYASVLQNQRGVPAWAQSLGVWIYEAGHDYKAAQLWIGQLLKAGIIQDSAELAFLEQRLKSLKNTKNYNPY